ncbi:hypothetical protein ACGFNP_25575 [Nonomuraea sp. NPDC049269]|uniref:hypothetical protein n=1 Tax=Nonomuraea sp. NPDC049269 TaxID=3364349 RepID=UPI003718F035
MALIIAEALRRTLRDLAARVQPYRLAVAAAGSSVLGVAILAYFGLGAFLLGASCMFVGATFGGLAGFDLARSRYTASLERFEREAARLYAELDTQVATNADLRALVANHKATADLASQRAESHLNELNRIRREVSGG